MHRLLLILVCGLLYSGSANALTCKNDYSGATGCASNANAAGDCETLGYSKTTSSECEHYIYCPFDTSYKKCVSVAEKSCAEQGFTTEDKSGWCGSLIYCPTDETYTLCAEAYENPCPTGYDSRLTSISDCGSQGSNGWTFESQTITGNNGENIVCGKCTAKKCSGYYANYQSVNDCGKTGSKGYTYSSCYSGEEKLGKCTAKTCSSYGYRESKDLDYICKTASATLGDYTRTCYDCVRCDSLPASYFGNVYLGNGSCLSVCAATTSSGLYGMWTKSITYNGRSGTCNYWTTYGYPTVSNSTYCCCKNKSYVSSSQASCKSY